MMEYINEKMVNYMYEKIFNNKNDKLMLEMFLMDVGGIKLDSISKIEGVKNENTSFIVVVELIDRSRITLMLELEKYDDYVDAVAKDFYTVVMDDVLKGKDVKYIIDINILGFSGSEKGNEKYFNELQFGKKEEIKDGRKMLFMILPEATNKEIDINSDKKLIWCKFFMCKNNDEVAILGKVDERFRDIKPFN